MQLRDRTVLLTGATGGIGHALARRLHAAGASLVLTGRRLDVLEPLAGELGARAVGIDLSDRDAVDRLARECAGVDVLVANAAVPASGDVLEYDIEQIDRALEVNLRAPIVLARLLAAGMAARGAGHIAFISSLSGKVATPRSGLYSATKFGLRGFGQGLRADLAPRGVGVSVVFPGFIRDAGMFHESGARVPRYVGTSTPQAVADATVSAIEDNRGEVDVAPLGLRVLSTIGSVAPGLRERGPGRAQTEAIATRLADGQRSKR